MTEKRTATRRNSDCTTSCPFVDSIDAFRKSIDELRMELHGMLKEHEGRIVKVEGDSRSYLSHRNDCTQTQDDHEERIRKMENIMPVLVQIQADMKDDIAGLSGWIKAGIVGLIGSAFGLAGTLAMLLYQTLK